MRDRNKRHNDSIERSVDRQVRESKAQTNRRIAHAFVDRLRDKEQCKVFNREQVKADRAYSLYRAAELEYEHDPITEVPDQVKLPSDYFDDVAHKTEYNQIYAAYYTQRYIDTNLEKYRSMSERIYNCHKSWFGDRYKKAGYFNVKRVFHCHNRWCWLCTHLKQAQRLCKFETMFETLLPKYDVYHLVFTIRNVKGNVLKDTLAKMQMSLRKIIKCFQGFKKIDGLDFTQYGFVGAVRSFEIVINPKDYHPHIHCLFLMKKDLGFVKKHINKFSFNKNNPNQVRPFSDLEILLQKMFYLAVNGQRINMKNIQALKIGYSCMMDCIDGKKWHEVFKYATKMSKDGASACTYKQFVLLDDIFCHMKLITGYGIFKGIDKKLDEKDQTAEILFEKVLIMLNRIETPERDIHIELDKLVEELHHNNVTVISKKMSYKYLQSIVESLHDDFHFSVEDGFAPF